MSNDERPRINVTSINQSGGITANQVNLGRTDRRLNPKMIRTLDKHLPKDKSSKVRVIAAYGDGEAIRLAEEIRLHLRELGWSIPAVDQAVRSGGAGANMGQVLSPNTDGGVDIFIGHQE